MENNTRKGNVKICSRENRKIKRKQGQNGGLTNKQVKLIELNKMIIDDNILFGFKAGYSNKEIADYQKKQKMNW